MKWLDYLEGALKTRTQPLKASVFKIHLHLKDFHLKRILQWGCLLGMCSLRFSYTDTQRLIQPYAKEGQLYLVRAAEIGIFYLGWVLEEHH